VATGDSLLHGTHGGRLFPAEDLQQVVAHHYPTEDVELAGRILQADHYHAVVGNPPYITVKDKALNAPTGACTRRATGSTLGVPFTERCWPFHRRGSGYVGMITANSS
jgi:hypothetical protein